LNQAEHEPVIDEAQNNLSRQLPLVRVLATLLAPDSGHAEVFGRDVVSEAPAVREMLGLTGQFAAVDEILTGRENLQMFGRLFDLSRAEARWRTAELLERLDLADAADRSAAGVASPCRRPCWGHPRSALWRPVILNDLMVWLGTVWPLAR
jgi:ABC-type Na+ transport system ATPase subunit NatA